MKYFYQPLKPFIVGQRFGENRACIDKATRSKVISCDGTNPPRGYESVYGSKGHTGIDLRAYHGQEVYCAQGGTIDSVDTNPRTGLDVRVRTTIGGRTFIHIYEHLLGYQGKVGDAVATGQLVGWADNTGFSSGDHLHFGVKELRDNRWYYVDPLPLMYDIYALDILKVKDTLRYIMEKLALYADNLAYKLRQKSRLKNNK